MEKSLRFYLRKWLGQCGSAEKEMATFASISVLTLWITLGLFWEFSILSFISIIVMIFVFYGLMIILLDTDILFAKDPSDVTIFNFWWRPFSISVDMSECSASSSELDEWCMEYCRGPYEYSYNDTWYFCFESDVMAFKIMWEGQ